MTRAEKLRSACRRTCLRSISAMRGICSIISATVRDDLRRCSSLEGNDRTAVRHCLDDHHAERLFPLDGIEKATSPTEQVRFLLLIDRPEVTDLPIVDQRFDHVLEVAYRCVNVAINRAC